MTEPAREIWERVYPRLSEGKRGGHGLALGVEILRTRLGKSSRGQRSTQIITLPGSP